MHRQSFIFKIQHRCHVCRFSAPANLQTLSLAWLLRCAHTESDFTKSFNKITNKVKAKKWSDTISWQMMQILRYTLCESRNVASIASSCKVENIELFKFVWCCVPTTNQHWGSTDVTDSTMLNRTWRSNLLLLCVNTQSCTTWLPHLQMMSWTQTRPLKFSNISILPRLIQCSNNGYIGHS